MHYPKYLGALSAFLIGQFGVSASAQTTIMINNSSFESMIRVSDNATVVFNDTGDFIRHNGKGSNTTATIGGTSNATLVATAGTYGFGANNWTVSLSPSGTDFAGTVQYYGSSVTGINGTNALAINKANSATSNATATISQTLATTFSANTDYTLSFLLGRSSNTGLGYAGAKVELLAGTTVLASFTEANSTSRSSGAMVSQSVTYTYNISDSSLVGQALGIRLSVTTANHTDTNARQTLFDNFQLTAIPEPAAFSAFAGLGILGFAVTRRRRS